MNGRTKHWKLFFAEQKKMSMKILFRKLKGLSESLRLWVSSIAAAAAAYLRLLAVFCEGRADRECERESVCV